VSSPPTDPASHGDFIAWLHALGMHGLGEQLQANPTAATLVGVLLTFSLSLGTLALVRFALVRILPNLVGRSATRWDDLVIEKRLLHRLSWGVPWLFAYELVAWIPHVSAASIDVFHRVATCALVLVGIRSLSALLRVVEAIYATYPSARHRPIKGYLQVVVLVASIFGAVIIVSVALDRSPWLLLSGLGAMTAVLLLVFRDTLLSLVAGIRITTNDLIRVGDWIEMPQFSADGDVIEIALHAVKVRNWDRTFTVIPTHAFLEHAFRNWRGMSDSGGRRIKRALHVDLSTVRFITDEEVKRFRTFVLLTDYIDRKSAELAAHNREIGKNDVVANARNLTNVGTLRAYIEAYLRQHSGVRQDMTLLVRQLAPTPEGLPIEIYCFSRDIAWAKYEALQADIFDHVLSVVPQFDLRVFQAPAGSDFARVVDTRSS
jgi:miniconductance mechanosensitive channel